MSCSINPFLSNVPISYPLKTQENKRFSDVFRGYKMGKLARNGLSNISFCLSLLLLLLSLFPLVSIFGRAFISSSKDVANTTAVVQLILKTISVSLLLTLKIAYYSRELPINVHRAVVNSTLKDFSQWSWLNLEMRLSKLFRPTTLNNQMN